MLTGRWRWEPKGVWENLNISNAFLFSFLSFDSFRFTITNSPPAPTTSLHTGNSNKGGYFSTSLSLLLQSKWSTSGGGVGDVLVVAEPRQTDRILKCQGSSGYRAVVVVALHVTEGDTKSKWLDRQWVVQQQRHNLQGTGKIWRRQWRWEGRIKWINGPFTRVLFNCQNNVAADSLNDESDYDEPLYNKCNSGWWMACGMIMEPRRRDKGRESSRVVVWFWRNSRAQNQIEGHVL